MDEKIKIRVLHCGKVPVDEALPFSIAPEHATIVIVPTFRKLGQYHHPEVSLDNIRRKRRS